MAKVIFDFLFVLPLLIHYALACAAVADRQEALSGVFHIYIYSPFHLPIYMLIDIAVSTVCVRPI